MRIALATVGTAGDVRPFAILARALEERGHHGGAGRSDAAARLARLVKSEDGTGSAIGLTERLAPSV